MPAADLLPSPDSGWDPISTRNRTLFPVIDALQGDGLNPLWHQVLVDFNAGFAPHQLVSEEDVLAAAASGEITLVETDEVYLCAVVGHKK